MDINTITFDIFTTCENCGNGQETKGVRIEKSRCEGRIFRCKDCGHFYRAGMLLEPFTRELGGSKYA